MSEQREAFPLRPDVLIIGGGVIGCSIAYHLTRRGCRNVVVAEEIRSEVALQQKRLEAFGSSFPASPMCDWRSILSIFLSIFMNGWNLLLMKVG